MNDDHDDDDERDIGFESGRAFAEQASPRLLYEITHAKDLAERCLIIEEAGHSLNDLLRVTRRTEPMMAGFMQGLYEALKEEWLAGR